MKRLTRFLTDWRLFGRFVHAYLKYRGYRVFRRFEAGKDLLVDVLYKQRGRFARPVLHVAVVSLGFLVVTVGPLLLATTQQQPEEAGVGGVLGMGYETNFRTIQAEAVRQFRGGEVITHLVAEGETISSIAQRYGLQPETVLWQNDLTERSVLRPGQELEILPTDGVQHKVARGETIFSIGKRYGLDENQVQAIIDYPFNDFLNDEDFALATGQFLIIPGGVRPDPSGSIARSPAFSPQLTPDAGAVSARGQFIWPASGRITQGYSFYHRAIDIANRSGGSILAADAGTVVVAGWPDNSGYGRRVIIDHGNGFVTLYAHLSTLQVQSGQRVNRGDVVGQMGNTGRSTGTHLHFEIRRASSLENPLAYLN